MLKYIGNFFSGSERSVLVKKNIIFNSLLQGIGILCSFLLVPLTLNYLNAEEYGVWLTLTSIVTWFNVCEIGIGLGLQNRLGECMALKDYKKGRDYVTVTYVVLTLIILVFLLLFFVVNAFIDWRKILNIWTLSAEAISSVVVIVVIFFAISFVVKTIGVVLAADQRTSIRSLLGLLGNVLSLVIIFILTRTTPSSLFKVALVFSASPVFISLLGTAILFRGRYRQLKPNFTKVNFKLAKNLIGLSLNFFVLQASSIIVFSTSNVIIARLMGPQDVTIYNICFKYFNVITLLFNLVLSPMWPAYTNAYALSDFEWMRNSIKKTRMMWYWVSLLSIFMLLVSPIVYSIWVGDKVHVPFIMSVAMAVYVIVGNWNNIYAQMLSGVGKIRLSIFNSLFNAIIFIPLGIYFTKYLGAIGVTIAMTVTILTSTFWQPIQSYKIIRGTAKGLWNK